MKACELIAPPNETLGRAFAAWANMPRWWGINPDCSRDEAEARFTKFIEEVCANWGLEVVVKK